jgi:hypothetical protein
VAWIQCVQSRNNLAVENTRVSPIVAHNRLQQQCLVQKAGGAKGGTVIHEGGIPQKQEKRFKLAQWRVTIFGTPRIS